MRENLKRIGVVGASGYLGSLLSSRLEEKGYEVVRLSRSSRGEGWRVFEKGCLRGLDAVFNFAGSPIDRRWSDEVKKDLLDSRVNPAKEISSWIEEMAEENRPSVSLSCSGVGYYGDRGDELLSECSTAGEGFIANLCEQWELASGIEVDTVRCVKLRLGVVLGKGSRAWVKMSFPYKFFMGGVVGNKESYFSWIHEEDAVNAMIHCLESENIEGSVNLCAKAVSYQKLANSIGEAMRRPSLIRVPVFVMKMLLGELADALLASLNVVPEALSRDGYRFEYLKIEEALAELTSQRNFPNL